MDFSDAVDFSDAGDGVGWKVGVSAQALGFGLEEDLFELFGADFGEGQFAAEGKVFVLESVSGGDGGGVDITGEQTL